jgi:hypothetical protein
MSAKSFSSLTGLAAVAVLVLPIAAAQDTAQPPRSPAPEPQAAFLPLQEYTELLRLQAERSENAAQTAAAALKGYLDLMKAESDRSAQATKHEHDTIDHALSSFLYIVSLCGTALVVGAGGFGWLLAAWHKANKADVEAEVRKQTEGEIGEAMKKARDTVSQQTAGFQNDVDRMRQDFTELQSRLSEIAALEQNVRRIATQMNRIERQVVSFQESEALTPELRKNLEDTLDAYRHYLRNIGYQSGERLAKFLVVPTLEAGALYNAETNQIVMSKELAVDPDVALREYTHHVLLDVKKREIPLWTSIQSGLADYLPCSFKNNPHFAEKSAPILNKIYGPDIAPQGYLRNMDNQRKFDEIDVARGKQAAGEVWGGALWDIRKLVGWEQADMLFLEAWIKSDIKDDSMDSYADFAWNVLSIARRRALPESALRAVFEQRGLPVIAKQSA